MTANLTSQTSSLKRFTLMVSGEDAIDAGLDQNAPPSGLPQERFLLGDRLPIAPVLLLGQIGLAIKMRLNICAVMPFHQ